jgi:multidrug resistance efflux pump
MDHTVKDPVMAVAGRFVRMRWRRPIELAAAGLAVAGVSLALAGFRPLDFGVRPAPYDPNAPLVMDGTVESLVYQDVGSPFNGRIAEMDVRSGKEVRKGELLFRMDPRPLQEELAAAKADQDAAWAAYKAARDNRDQDRRAAERNVEELEGALGQAQRQLQAAQQAPVQPTEQDADQAQTDGTVVVIPQQSAPLIDPQQVADLQSRLAAAQQETRQQARQWDQALWQQWQAYNAASRRVRKAQATLASAARRAPIDGVVSTVAAQPGAEVAAFDPVVRVEDPKSFRVVAMVDEKVRRPLQEGTFMPVAIPQGRLAGSLDRIEDGWDKQALHYYLWVKPDQPERLQPGEQVELELPAHPAMVASG